MKLYLVFEFQKRLLLLVLSVCITFSLGAQSCKPKVEKEKEGSVAENPFSSENLVEVRRKEPVDLKELQRTDFVPKLSGRKLNIKKNVFNDSAFIEAITYELGEVQGLVYYPADSLPWTYSMYDGPENGQLGYFFFDGTTPSLQEPHIQMQFFLKSLPSCGTVDSLFIWLKQQFINSGQQGRLIDESETVKTADGIPVEILQVYRPEIKSDSAVYTQKSMAWGYIPYGDKFIGFNLTAIDPAEYQTALRFFKALLKTYHKE